MDGRWANGGVGVGVGVGVGLDGVEVGLGGVGWDGVGLDVAKTTMKKLFRVAMRPRNISYKPI